MKRFIYEIHNINVDYSYYEEYITEYVNAENYREAKKLIKDLYADEIKSKTAEISMIAEIKYEKK